MLGRKSSFADLVSYKDKNSIEKIKHREIKKLKDTSGRVKRITGESWLSFPAAELLVNLLQILT